MSAYLQSAIHAYAKRKATVCRAEIAAHFGITSMAASQQLRRLVASGYLIPHGSTNLRTYSVSSAPPPRDGRGKSDATLRMLERHRQHWHKPLCKAMEKRGLPPPRLVPVPKPRIELERVWGWGT